MNSIIICIQLFYYISNFAFIKEIAAARHRPRGIGLVKLPFGVSDHRSGPAFPNLYIAGNKLYHKTQSVPDVSLPGQEKHFSGRAQFNPFNQIIGFAHNNDIGDSWGTGFAMHGINFQDHDVRRNYKALVDLPRIETDGMYQPFGTAFLVGAEVDFIKFRSHAVALDIPLPGLNEMFDFETEILEKLDREFELEEVEEEEGGEGTEGEGHHTKAVQNSEHAANFELNVGEHAISETETAEHSTASEGNHHATESKTHEGHSEGENKVEYVTKEVVDVHHSRINLPIPSSDERLPFKQHFFDRFNDIQINYGQVLPHINFANIDHRDIVDKLIQNRANPALIG